MATVSLDAQLRTTTGKGAARKARAAGSLPAVVYRGGQSATAISLDPEALELAFQKTGDRNTLIELVIAGEGKRTCLVREAQRNPATRRLEHVDFFEVAPDDVVTVTVKTNPVGTAVGTKLGGKLQLIRRTLDVRCKPAFIPTTVDVDVTQMEVNTFIRASQVTPPAGCELVFDADFNVVAVLGKRAETGKPAEA
ncbi:50S ribosomal protein L25 [Myxococcota bacterium]|nr:50S ribosomal protein L25 [Myxococcota bacterium]